MENTKTISYLNGKAWYRALKVIYILLAIYFCVMALGGGGVLIYMFTFTPEEFDITMNGLLRGILGLLAIPALLSLTWLVLQIPKWIFYYIYLGTRTPEK